MTATGTQTRTVGAGRAVAGAVALVLVALGGAGCAHHDDDGAPPAIPEGVTSVPLPSDAETPPAPDGVVDLREIPVGQGRMKRVGPAGTQVMITRPTSHGVQVWLGQCGPQGQPLREPLGFTVRCSAGGGQWDAATGEPLTKGAAPLRAVPGTVTGDELHLDLSALPGAAPAPAAPGAPGDPGAPAAPGAAGGGAR